MLHSVPEAHVPVPSAPTQVETQKLSPWICAQIPPPQSAFERHSVQAGTVDVPDSDPSVLVPPESVVPRVVAPPSGPETSAVPPAQAADHATPPETARRRT